MAEPKKPKLVPPISTPNAGRICIIVSGPVTIKSSNSKVIVVRKD